jgi:simple sugar transport system permease protein
MSSNIDIETLSDSAQTAEPDERLREIPLYRKLLARPELGAISGTIFIFLFFIIVAGDSGMFSPRGIINWLEVSAQLAILAAGACLLMIAGEFDLSIGSMVGFSGMIIAISTVYYDVPVWGGILLAFVFAMIFGFINGLIVVKTKLPSFIVTLAFLFILRGLTIAISRILTNRTLVGGLKQKSEGDWFAYLFGGELGTSLFTTMGESGFIETLPNGAPVVSGIPMVIVWSIVIGGFAQYVLLKTKFGNWIYSSGGDAIAARNVGVPVDRVKILLFMFSAACATIFAACQVVDFGSADSQRGMLKEFEAIIAAVIGGTLLTGGYGSVLGAWLGALIFGVVQMGIFYTGADSDWFRVFMGGMLLIAVIFNNFIRKKVTEAH